MSDGEESLVRPDPIGNGNQSGNAPKIGIVLPRRMFRQAAEEGDELVTKGVPR
jgi:hypothetical protein